MSGQFNPSEYTVTKSNNWSTAEEGDDSFDFTETTGQDQAREDNEPGLPGVVIYSDLNLNGVYDDSEPATTHDTDWIYVPVRRFDDEEGPGDDLTTATDSGELFV